MNTLAYAVLAVMIVFYVLLDGYDLGVAALEFFVAPTDEDRKTVMASVGPFVHGNEVWLIAAGGALFALFPEAYASSFSGFYLPFMVVLWLLMFRGIALELRGHLAGRLWHGFWDVAFSGSSLLLIVFFGVAIGNLLRGVPLDTHGYFQGTFAFLLNPYATEVGIFALVVLAVHGATFLRLRCEGTIAARSRAVIMRAWWLVLILQLQLSFTTIAQRAPITGDFGEMARLVGWLAPLPFLSIAALIGIVVFTRRERHGAAFGASCAYVATLLVSAACTMYPYIIPSFPAGQGGMSIFTASPSPPALYSALVVTIVGSIGVLIYATIVFRRFGLKLTSDTGR
jgi:cytochrome bd ubiquinol oxidase subunit II